MWNKEKIKAYLIRCPYASTLHGIKVRCKKGGSYAKFGVKNYLSMLDLKFLWERDKASLMKTASIDRIDTYEDYTLANCRYIELSENVKRKKRFATRERLKRGKWAMRYDKCIICGKTTRKHEGHGKCGKCYYKEYNREYWLRHK